MATLTLMVGCGAEAEVGRNSIVACETAITSHGQLGKFRQMLNEPRQMSDSVIYISKLGPTGLLCNENGSGVTIQPIRNVVVSGDDVHYTVNANSPPINL